MEGHETLKAAITAAIFCALVIPAGVEKINIAARSQRNRGEAPRRVISVHGLD